MAFIDHIVKDKIYLVPVIGQGIYFMRVVGIGVEGVQHVTHYGVALAACQVALNLFLTQVTAQAGLFL